VLLLLLLLLLGFCYPVLLTMIMLLQIRRGGCVLRLLGRCATGQELLPNIRWGASRSLRRCGVGVECSGVKWCGVALSVMVDVQHMRTAVCLAF